MKPDVDIRKLLNAAAQTSYSAGMLSSEKHAPIRVPASRDFIYNKHGHGIYFKSPPMFTTFPRWSFPNPSTSVFNADSRSIYHLNFELKEGNYFDQFFSEFSSFGALLKTEDNKVFCQPPATL